MNTENVKWAIPPELKRCHDDFQILLKTLYADRSNTPPLMLIGPPGTGKTLFTETFTKAYCTAHEMDPSEIIPINLAAIPETLIDGMLFGWEKGSFTNGIVAFAGLLIVAAEKSGLIILEEIGELPKTTQAKLLTFIEGGYYYKLGKPTSLRLDKPLQIVATTNRSHDVFRQDFYDRFFPFHIPGLHERRGDILYHFHVLDPDLTASWRPWEILLLLSYNWPGNVREIERFTKGAKIQWAKNAPSVKRLWEAILGPIADSETDALRPYGPPLLTMPDKYETLSQDDIFSMMFVPQTVSESDKKWLEGILQKYGLSFLFDGKALPCFNSGKWKNNYFPQENPAILSKIKDFEKAYDGLRVLCNLFQQNILGKFNLLSLSKQNRDPHYFLGAPKGDIPKKDHGRVDRLHALISEHYDGPVASDFNGLTEKEVLCRYHQDLLSKTKGNKTHAARIAGLPRSTYCDQLKQLNIE